MPSNNTCSSFKVVLSSTTDTQLSATLITLFSDSSTKVKALKTIQALVCILSIAWVSMINITIHFPIFPHISFEPEPRPTPAKFRNYFGIWCDKPVMQEKRLCTCNIRKQSSGVPRAAFWILLVLIHVFESISKKKFKLDTSRAIVVTSVKMVKHHKTLCSWQGKKIHPTSLLLLLVPLWQKICYH